jgi:hypothetical protein
LRRVLLGSSPLIARGIFIEDPEGSGHEPEAPFGESMRDNPPGVWSARVRKRMAAPKRVGMIRFSYDGYATVAGLASTPDVCAAGWTS